LKERKSVEGKNKRDSRN